MFRSADIKDLIRHDALIIRCPFSLDLVPLD